MISDCIVILHDRGLSATLKIQSLYYMLLSPIRLISKRKPQNSHPIVTSPYSYVSILDHLRNVFFGRVVGIHLIESPVLHPVRTVINS